jgi:hypothetical protein
MKKTIYSIIIIATTVLTSCNADFLNTVPKDALSPATFWKTQKDLNLALTGCYSSFEDGYSILYRDCGSDNAYNNFPWEGWTNIGNGTLSSADPGSSYYNFTTINRCNEFIDNCDNATAVSEDVRKIYKAQAQFIRAYNYYKLTINYGDVPLIVHNFTTPKEAQIVRNP